MCFLLSRAHQLVPETKMQANPGAARRQETTTKAHVQAGQTRRGGEDAGRAPSSVLRMGEGLVKGEKRSHGCLWAPS